MPRRYRRGATPPALKQRGRQRAPRNQVRHPVRAQAPPARPAQRLHSRVRQRTAARAPAGHCTAPALQARAEAARRESPTRAGVSTALAMHTQQLTHRLCGGKCSHCSVILSHAVRVKARQVERCAARVCQEDREALHQRARGGNLLRRARQVALHQAHLRGALYRREAQQQQRARQARRAVGQRRLGDGVRDAERQQLACAHGTPPAERVRHAPLCGAGNTAPRSPAVISRAFSALPRAVGSLLDQARSHTAESCGRARALTRVSTAQAVTGAHVRRWLAPSARAPRAWALQASRTQSRPRFWRAVEALAAPRRTAWPPCCRRGAGLTTRAALTRARAAPLSRQPEVMGTRSVSGTAARVSTAGRSTLRAPVGPAKRHTRPGRPARTRHSPASAPAARRTAHTPPVERTAAHVGATRWKQPHVCSGLSARALTCAGVSPRSCARARAARAHSAAGACSLTCA